MSALPSQPDTNATPEKLAKPRFSFNTGKERPDQQFKTISFRTFDGAFRAEDLTKANVGGEPTRLVKGLTRVDNREVPVFFPIQSKDDPIAMLGDNAVDVSPEQEARKTTLLRMGQVEKVPGLIFDAVSNRSYPIPDLDSFTERLYNISEELKKSHKELKPTNDYLGKYIGNFDGNITAFRESIIQGKFPRFYNPVPEDELAIKKVNTMLREVIEGGVKRVDEAKKSLLDIDNPSPLKPAESPKSEQKLPPLGGIVGSMLEASRNPFLFAGIPEIAGPHDIKAAYQKMALRLDHDIQQYPENTLRGDLVRHLRRKIVPMLYNQALQLNGYTPAEELQKNSCRAR